MADKRIMVQAELVDLAAPWPELCRGPELDRPVLRHRLSYCGAAASVVTAPATLRAHPRSIDGPDPLRLPFESSTALRSIGCVAFAVIALVLATMY